VLYTETSGRGDPVVLVHGFTQSGRSWDVIRPTLAQRHTVITVDAPGHGHSAPVAVDLPEGADLMVAAAGRPAAWVGYSMGGRFTLHVACRHPASVTRMVLVSATAGIDDPAARAARREADEAMAARVETEGVAEFVRWWLDRPLFATLPSHAAAVESRLGGTSAGLASSLRLAGAGNQQPLWSELWRLQMPVLVVAGDLDPTYAALARRLVQTIGENANLVVIPQAGHACHLEQPDAFLEAVAPFLADH
jgi:2-succinyl-6-hydroxy-2,4-cyclohexadiene-1-carboxylate synthase